MHVVIVLNPARATSGDVNAGMFSDSNPAAPPELGGISLRPRVSV
jgi:hypothetical protein